MCLLSRAIVVAETEQMTQQSPLNCSRRGNKVCARQVCFLTVLWSSLFYTTIFRSMFALCLFSLLSLVQALYTLMEFSPTIENVSFDRRQKKSQ